MTALDLAVDCFDWTIDALRGVCGFPPLPPQLVKLEFDQLPTVRVATRLRLETRRTLHAFLSVEQGGLVLFEGAPPRNGGIGVVPLTGALMRVHVRLESRHSMSRHGCCTEAIFEPLPNGPVIERFDAPSKVLIGDSVACAWHVPAAERVRLAVIEDGNVDDRLGPPSGQILLRPAGPPGRLLLRLTAENSWGQSSVSRSVKVVAPKLRIALPRPIVQSGHPGEEVRFEWRVTGASSVWLITPDSDRPQPVDEDGLLSVTLGWRPAEFHLIARGYGGAESSALLRAVPQPFACLEE